jgi:hypothetical protein
MRFRARNVETAKNEMFMVAKLAESGAGSEAATPVCRITLSVALALLAIIALAHPWCAEAAPGGWTQAQVNTATQNGVAYIDSQQNANGSIGISFPIAETGMALVAYGVLANGSFSNLSPTYQTHVTNAITWLLGQQAADGSWADGGFYKTYSTGIALAGLSFFTGVNAAIPGAITKGRSFLVGEFQGPSYTSCSSADDSETANYCGGWNYEPDIGRSDESNTGYAMFGLQVTGGVPAAIVPDNINWQHHIQEINTNPFATRNDGGGDYQPGFIGVGSSNANDTGTMLFGLAYDGVLDKTDPNVAAGLVLGQDVLDEYELSQPAYNMVYHGGATADGTCTIGNQGCDWFFSGGEGGFHYSMFSLTKGLGEFIPPNLTDATNWYAKVVDLLLTQQGANGAWPQDGRDDASTLLATAFSVSSLGLVAVPTPTPSPTPSPTPVPPTVTPSMTPATPTPPTKTPTPPTPTPVSPLAGGMLIPPPAPVAIAAGPGATVSSGSFKVQNTSGTTLLMPAVTISFDNADLFSSATVTATVGSITSTATVNPVTGGNSPEQPNNTDFILQPPLVVPTGETASFSLAVTVTSNPQLTRRGGPVMYAAMVGGGSSSSNAFLLALALLELCASGISTSRRKRVLMAFLLLLALASQVGCDNGSVPSPPPAATGVVQSTQTAMQLGVMKQENDDPVVVTGLPVVMGTVSLK